MAMSKKEQAEMERLRKDLALARAMRWPSYPRPEAVTREWIDAHGEQEPGRYGTVARGWFYNAHFTSYYQPRVSYGCSNGINHGDEGDKTTTQGMGRMFATKADALRALRLELTETAAKVLAAVDRQLEEAEREGA